MSDGSTKSHRDHEAATCWTSQKPFLQHVAVQSVNRHVAQLSCVLIILISLNKSLTLSLVYYRLFDKNGRVVSLNSHYPSAPADGYTGQIDLNQVAPPNSVADIEKAITDQEGCKDAFISADWQLFPSPTSATPLSDTSTLSPGVGSKQTKYLVLRTTADILQERAASGIFIVHPSFDYMCLMLTFN